MSEASAANKLIHQYCADGINPAGGFIYRTLQVGIADRPLKLQTKSDRERKQLVEDCHLLNFVPPQQDSGFLHYPLTNPQTVVIENAEQIFHVGAQQPSNLDLTHFINALRSLSE